MCIRDRPLPVGVLEAVPAPETKPFPRTDFSSADQCAVLPVVRDNARLFAAGVHRQRAELSAERATAFNRHHLAVQRLRLRAIAALGAPHRGAAAQGNCLDAAV